MKDFEKGLDELERYAKLKKIKSDISKLKIFLILHTIITLTFFFGLSMNLIPWIEQNLSYNESLIIFGLMNYLGIAIFLWYIWKKYPGDKKKKTNDSLMIVFVGIIGMWLWLPNEKELNKLKF